MTLSVGNGVVTDTLTRTNYITVSGGIGYTTTTRVISYPDHRQVNPIYGWWQGRVLVRHDDHGRRVPVTHDLESIYEVLPRRSLDRREISVGAAEVIVTRPTTAASRPLSLDEFNGRMRTLADRP